MWGQTHYHNIINPREIFSHNLTRVPFPLRLGLILATHHLVISSGKKISANPFQFLINTKGVHGLADQFNLIEWEIVIIGLNTFHDPYHIPAGLQSVISFFRMSKDLQFVYDLEEHLIKFKCFIVGYKPVVAIDINSCFQLIDQ